VNAPGQPRRFSVLIANHNHAALVTRAVDSVLAQDYPTALREVIVTDDGSSDDSLQRLAAYQGRADVTVVAQPNRGQTAAFAAALARASGDWICLLDADDRCLPGKLRQLERWLQAHQADPDTLFLCHDLEILDGADGPAIADTWFDLIGLQRVGEQLHVAAAHHFFPFSVTSGMVFGRPLLQRLMDCVPQWEWPMGSDALLGHTAMLLVGEVQYCRQVLGSYVVHAGNNFAAVVDGRFRQKPVWHGRWPKKLRFLELLLDSLPLAERDRADRLGYLGRVEHAVRAVPTSRSHTPALLSVVVDATAATAEAAAATAAALAAQRNALIELLWVCTEADVAALPPPPAAAGRAPLLLAAGADEYQRCRAGAQAARGGYLCFLQAGDRPDPRFAERHLQAHRYGNLPMLTLCDLRLLDARGSVQHVGVMGTAAGWGQGGADVPAFGHLLRDWPLAPLPTMVIRRTPFVAAFFAPEQAPLEPRRTGWLLGQFLVQMGGATRLAENLLDLPLPPTATANASWLSQFMHRSGPLPPVDLAAAATALFAAYARARTEERSAFSEAWEARFLRWLLQSGGADMPARLAQQAQQAGDAAFAARVAAVLRQLASRP